MALDQFDREFIYKEWSCNDFSELSTGSYFEDEDDDDDINSQDVRNEEVKIPGAELDDDFGFDFDVGEEEEDEEEGEIDWTFDPT